MWTKIQFPEHGMEHANSPWPTSKTTKQKHWKVACQTGLYDDLSLLHMSTAVTGSTDHMKAAVLVIITILKKKLKQRCSHTPMLKSEPLWACFTCWNVATVSVCLWSTPDPLCIFHSWEQEDRRPTHSLSWPFHWQAGSTGYLIRKDGQGELLVEVVVVEDLGALGTKEVDEEGGVWDLLVQVLKTQPPSSSYNKP